MQSVRPSTDPVVEGLKESPTYSLSTFRRTGEAVETPIWGVYLESEGAFFGFSADSAGKVKRLRNSDRALFGACGVRGEKAGVHFPARATIVDDPSLSTEVYGALHRKYGWQMRLLDFGSRLARKIDRRVVLKVEVLRAEHSPTGS